MELQNKYLSIPPLGSDAIIFADPLISNFGSGELKIDQVAQVTEREHSVYS